MLLLQTGVRTPETGGAMETGLLSCWLDSDGEHASSFRPSQTRLMAGLLHPETSCGTSREEGHAQFCNSIRGPLILDLAATWVTVSGMEGLMTTTAVFRQKIQQVRDWLANVLKYGVHF